MKLKWWGHACFKITAADGTAVITDPYPDIGYQPIDDTADIVTVSHDHFDHNAVDQVGGNPTVIKTAGVHSVKGLQITAIDSVHDDAAGAKRGKNLIFILNIDGSRIVHLGDQGIILTEEQLKQIGAVDVLMLPVGGNYTINADEAYQVVQQLNPKVVVPMHYKTEVLDFDITGVEEFTKLFPQERVKTLPDVEMTLENFPDEQVVYLLQYVR